MIVYCHKPNPKDSGDDGGTRGAKDVSADSISVDALFSGEGTLVVKIAGKVLTTQKCDTGLCTMSVQYDKDAQGDVTVHIQRNGKEVAIAGGTSIGPPANGKVNFNAVVGGLSSANSTGNVTAVVNGTSGGNSSITAVVGAAEKAGGNVTAVLDAKPVAGVGDSMDGSNAISGKTR